MVFFALSPGDVLNAEDLTAWPVYAGSLDLAHSEFFVMHTNVGF